MISNHGYRQSQKTGLISVLVIIVLTVLSSLVPIQSYARPLVFKYSVNLSAAATDNIAQTASNINGTVMSGGLSFLLDYQDSEALQILATGYTNKIYYSDASLKNETRKAFDAGLLYKPSQTHFRLSLGETIAQVPLSRFAVNDVDNLRDVQITIASPSYYFDLTRTDRINIGYDFVSLNDSEGLSSRDGEQYSIFYAKTLSPLSKLSLHALQLDVSFSDNGGTDYRREDYFVRWETLTPVTTIGIEAGRSRITPVFGMTENNDFYRFFFERQINRTNRMRLALEDGFVNALATRFGPETAKTATNAQVVFFDNALTQRKASFNIAHTEQRFNWNVGLFDLTYETQNLAFTENQKGLDGLISVDASKIFGKKFRPTLDFSLSRLRYFRRIDNVTTDIWQGAVRARFFATDKLSFYTEFRRRTARSGLAIENVDENRFTVGFTLAPKGFF